MRTHTKKSLSCGYLQSFGHIPESVIVLQDICTLCEYVFSVFVVIKTEWLIARQDFQEEKERGEGGI